MATYADYVALQQQQDQFDAQLRAQQRQFEIAEAQQSARNSNSITPNLLALRQNQAQFEDPKNPANIAAQIAQQQFNERPQFTIPSQAELSPVGIPEMPSVQGFQGLPPPTNLPAPALPPFQNLPAPTGLGPPTTFPMDLGVGSPEITISPEVRALVARIYQAQREVAQQNLQQEASTAAGRRGLTMWDTPIADPYLRNLALMESQLGGSEAQSLIGLNTNQRDFLQQQAIAQEQARQARQAFLESAGQFRSSAAEDAARFRATFGENAAMNRANFGEAANQFRATFGEQGNQFRSNLQELANQFRSQLAEQAAMARAGLAESGAMNRANLGENATQFRLGLATQFPSLRLPGMATGMAMGGGIQPQAPRATRVRPVISKISPRPVPQRTSLIPNSMLGLA